MSISEAGSTIPEPSGPSRFAGALIDILDRVEYRRVDPADLDDPVYRHRYEAYRREGSYPFNDLGVLRDDFDDYATYPNSWTFGVYIDDALVSSIRVHHLTPQFRKSPANSLFSDILEPLLDQGASFIDPTRFTVDFEAGLAYPALPFLTMRLGVTAALHFGATYGLHCVRSEHGPFYKRVMGATLMCAARRWPDVGFPMELWGTRIADVYHSRMNRYPFFYSSIEERQALFAPPHRGPVWVSPSTSVAEARQLFKPDAPEAESGEAAGSEQADNSLLAAE
jgi:hypothetical protein